MKNLKKVLALVLVLTMVLALGVTASAVSYSDADKIVNTEAVDVMSAIGVLDGTNGKFNPEGIVTREQAAKIATYMLMGKSSADKLTATVAPFADVAAGRWSAGAITYCKEKGIISGVGKNKFEPDGQLTGLQFAKIMLTALGYDANKEGFIGASWAVNVADKAIKAGIDAGIENLNAPMTRQDAAQMAFNTLKAIMVEYTNAGGSISIGGVDIGIGGSPASEKTNTKSSYISTDYAADGTLNPANTTVTAAATVHDGKMQFCELYFPKLKLSGATADSYGRPGHKTWSNNGATIGEYGYTKPVASYTTLVSAAQLYKDLGSKAVIDQSGSTLNNMTATADKFIANGVKSTANITVSARTTSLGGNGIVTEIYKTATADHYIVVQIQPTLVKVTTKNIKATATVGAHTLYKFANGSGAAVGNSAGYKVFTSTVSEDDVDEAVVNGEIKSGDYAMVYGYGDSYAVVEPITTVSGVVSGYTSATNSYTIDSVKYQISGAANTNVATAVDTTKETKLYAIDAYGYIIGAISSNKADEFVYVLYAKKTAYLVDNEVKDVAKATVITADGELKTVNVSKLVVYAANGSEDGTATKTVAADIASALGTATPGGATTAAVYKYELDSNGDYVLTKNYAKDGSATNYNVASHTAITKGVPGIDGASPSKYATTATKYYVAKYNEAGIATSVTTYVGYHAVESMTTVTGSILDTDGVASTIEVVFIAKCAEAGATTSYVYLTGDYKTDTNGKTFYSVITKDGAPADMALTNVSATASEIPGLYTISGGAATKVDVSSNDTALVIGSGTDGLYGKSVKYFTYNNGLLMSSTDDETYGYLAAISAETPVYVYANGAIGETVTTAADLSSTTGSVIVIAVNATNTAIDAIYIA